jgi:hypothetical protein
VVGDLDVEGDESVTVTLSNASGGQIQTATAVTDILNDDATIAISALSAAKAEGNSGTTAYTFTVTRSGYLGEAETVDFAITGTGINPADGADFGGSLPSGTLTLPAGQSSVTLTVLVSGDLAGEPTKTSPSPCPTRPAASPSPPPPPTAPSRPTTWCSTSPPRPPPWKATPATPPTSTSWSPAAAT